MMSFSSSVLVEFNDLCSVFSFYWMSCLSVTVWLLFWPGLFKTRTCVSIRSPVKWGINKNDSNIKKPNSKALKLCSNDNAILDFTEEYKRRNQDTGRQTCFAGFWYYVRLILDLHPGKWISKLETDGRSMFSAGSLKVYAAEKTDNPNTRLLFSSGFFLLPLPFAAFGVT